jgi:2-dehydro-3-deoxygluconokinase
MIEMAQASGLWKLGVAGDTLNTAWYFRRSTAPHDWSVDYFTRLGTDRYSDRIAGFLDAAGIGTSWIAREPVRQPGLYTNELENGERSVTYWRGQSAARLLADDEQLLGDAIAAADTVYFSGITLAILAPDRRDALLRLVIEARRAGSATVFDSNIRPRLWESAAELRQGITQAAAVSSIALPSFEDDRSLFGDATPRDCARRYAEAGCDEVVVKNAGAEMCVAVSGVTKEIEKLERVEPVDTTGAGDSFNGAYLARRAAGDEPRAAAIFAHALASEVVRHHGALVETASTGIR